MTYVLWAALILVLLDDILVRHQYRDQDSRWLSVLGEKDEKIRRLRRKLRRLLSQ